MELVRTRNHFVVDVLTEKLYGTTVAKVCRILVTMIELATYLLICWFGWIWDEHADLLRRQARNVKTTAR